MRLILVGQAAFAARVLEAVRQRGHEVVAVYCPPTRPGGPPDPVKEAAEGVGIPVRERASLKGEPVREEWRVLDADLALLAYVTQIVPPALLEIPRRGSICFHPSLLPRYRGGSAINWQIIKGEERTGVTVFWPDAGIDTGPILLQKSAVIRPDDTAGSLYYETLFPLGVAAMAEAVDLVASGRAPKIPQDESQASYDPLCRDEHARVAWARPVGEVYNLIRGCDPQPGAYVEWGGKKVRLYDARRVDGPSPDPGVVGAIDAAGVVVGARGGAIRIGRMRLEAGKVRAHEAASALGLTVGQRFGDPGAS